MNKSLASKTDQWEQYDKDMAFCIYLVEKEFNVGAIDDTFPLLKFWNLLDETNNKRYNDLIKKGEKGGTGTFG